MRTVGRQQCLFIGAYWTENSRLELYNQFHNTTRYAWDVSGQTWTNFQMPFTGTFRIIFPIAYIDQKLKPYHSIRCLKNCANVISAGNSGQF